MIVERDEDIVDMCDSVFAGCVMCFFFVVVDTLRLVLALIAERKTVTWDHLLNGLVESVLEEQSAFKLCLVLVDAVEGWAEQKGDGCICKRFLCGCGEKSHRWQRELMPWTSRRTAVGLNIAVGWLAHEYGRPENWGITSFYENLPFTFKLNNNVQWWDISIENATHFWLKRHFFLCFSWNAELFRGVRYFWKRFDRLLRDFHTCVETSPEHYLWSLKNVWLLLF